MRQARTIAATESPEVRAHRMRVGVVAAATGRSREDQLQSLMLGEVVGMPSPVAQNAPASFRGQLHRNTSLGGFRGRR